MIPLTTVIWIGVISSLLFVGVPGLIGGWPKDAFLVGFVIFWLVYSVWSIILEAVLYAA
jgi:hypothetical protein